MSWARVTSATLGAQTGVNPGAGATTWAAGSLGAAVSVGHKIAAAVVVWNVNNVPTVGSITDSLGNTYTKDVSVAATDGSGHVELSVWSAAITVGGTPALTLHFTNIDGAVAFGSGIAAGAYSGLSTASGAAGIDLSKIANGVGSTADSGTTAGTTAAANELKVGAYQDDGWSTTLTAGTLDTTYTFFKKIDANGNAQAAVEDVDAGAAGSTARAEVGTGTASANWGMAVVVYKLAAGGVTTPVYIPGSRPFPFTPGASSLRGF